MDFAGTDAVFDVGFDPVFEAFAHLGLPMNERDARAAAEKIERRFGGRIFSADDDDVLIPIRVGVGEIVRDMRQIFAGNSEAVRAVVVAGGDDDFPAVILVTSAGLG